MASGNGLAGAAAGVNVDANNRQLHIEDRERIAKKADGDKKAEERLKKAACLEVKCWAQFPEGSPLYKQNYVSPAEAAGLTQELAWVNQQKASGAFVYTPFQKFTDGVAATTGMSSVNGQGTFNGQFISNPNPPFRGNYCATAECAAGVEPFRGNNPPDYVSVQGSIYIASGGFAVNLHSGEMFGQWSLGRSYPGYSVKPGGSLTFGKIVGGSDAEITNNFLKGANGSATYFYPIPGASFIGAGGGINYSYSGQAAIETGISIPSGAVVNPVGYGFDINKNGSKTESK